MTASPQHRVAHPLQSHRKGWVIVRSTTALADLHAAETYNVEVKH